jgi:DNA-binding ferritin-like protein (Dps family)
MFDTKISNILFGAKDFEQLNQKFKENPDQSKWLRRQAMLEWILNLGEPFRKWIGMWPAGKVLWWIDDAIIEWQNGTLQQKIEELFQEVEESKKEVERVTGQTIDEVIDGTENIVDNIKDSEPGFRLWCRRNEKEFTGYDEGIGTTVEDGKAKYWYFDTDENTFKENKPE